MSPSLEKIVTQIEKDITANINLSPAFNNAEEAIIWLNKSTDESPLS